MTKPPIQSRKFKLSCSLIAVMYRPSRLKLLKKIVAKFPQVFPRPLTARTKRKRLNVANTKRSRKQGGGGSIPAIPAARARKKIHDTLGSIQAALYLTLLLYTVFLVSHKATIIQCHCFINPYNLIRKRVELNKDFSWPILITTLCKIRICVTLCRLESQT